MHRKALTMSFILTVVLIHSGHAGPASTPDRFSTLVKVAAAKPISVVFILDNSGSMDVNDPTMIRFTMIRNMLDTLAVRSPETEAGLVVFTRRLAFDHRDNAFFQTAFPGDTSQHDSFVPLTSLNAMLAEGRTGADTLKALLNHDSLGNLVYATKRPASRNNIAMGRGNMRDGTDITLGFEAGKLAMADAKSPKSDQFFIFLSDGTPSAPDDGRQAFINDYVLGKATPTTFTVFFDTGHIPPSVPSPIVKMTNNIKDNGYSTSNPKSSYWPATVLAESLRFIFIETMLNPEVSSIRGTRHSSRIAAAAGMAIFPVEYDAAGKSMNSLTGTAGKARRSGIQLHQGR